jgi:hypothetical protein
LGAGRTQTAAEKSQYEQRPLAGVVGSLFVHELALLWQINRRLTIIGHLWHLKRGAVDGGAGYCTDGLAEAVR